MKSILCIVLAASLLSACADATFVTDAAPVEVSAETPDHFELPGRFALVRTVYGRETGASQSELDMWAEIAERHRAMGHFSPLVSGNTFNRLAGRQSLIETAREQRFTYLLLMAISPGAGTSNISLYHVGSGGVMATARASVPGQARRGFWGGRIRNPQRLARVAEKIVLGSSATVENMLLGVAMRQK